MLIVNFLFFIEFLNSFFKYNANYVVHFASDTRPMYVFSSVNEYCKVPCDLDIGNTREIIFLTHNTNYKDDYFLQTDFFEFGIIHLPKQGIPNEIIIPAHDSSDSFNGGVICENLPDYRTCWIVPDADSVSLPLIWDINKNEKIRNIELSPDRKFFILNIEKSILKPDHREVWDEVKLGRTVDLIEKGISYINQLPAIPIPPQYQGTGHSFSSDSEWFVMTLSSVDVLTSKNRDVYYRILNTEDPSKHFDILKNLTEYSLCSWNDEKPWLLCNVVPDYRNIFVFTIENNHLETFEIPIMKFTARHGYDIRWLDEYLISTNSYEKINLHDPRSGEISGTLNGDRLFAFSSKEKLLITHNTVYQESRPLHERLFFYSGLKYEGTKVFTRNGSAKLRIEWPDVQQLEGLYKFLLNFPSDTIDQGDIFQFFGITPDPNHTYLLSGDWLQTNTVPAFFTEYPQYNLIRDIYEKIHLREYNSPLTRLNDIFLINSITDCYFFPKPEAQE